METKGKRSARIAAPPENPIPQTVPSETPIQIQPQAAADSDLVMAPSRSDVAVQRLPSLVLTTNATRGRPAYFGGNALVAAEESRAAGARGFDALSEEMAAL